MRTYKLTMVTVSKATEVRERTNSAQENNLSLAEIYPPRIFGVDVQRVMIT